MTPELVTLALRAVAAGAPNVLLAHVARLWPGDQWRQPTTGLLYEVAMVGADPMLIPLLTDPSWLGWVLCEVERRRYRCLYATASNGVCRAAVWFPGSDHCERSWDAPDRPAALVAMLEATK